MLPAYKIASFTLVLNEQLSPHLHLGQLQAAGGPVHVQVPSALHRTDELF